MRSYFFMLLWMCCTIVVNAQDNGNGRPSPLKTWDASFGQTQVQIKYGAPSVKGREIWGKLVPYGEVWRTGANEATTFETSQDLKVEGKVLPKGKYALFTIPGKKEWTIIFNKDSNQWGSYAYKSTGDVLRVKVQPVEMDSELAEQMSFVSISGGVALKWEKLMIPINLQE